MAKDKKSFLIYCDIIHTVEHLTDEEKGRLFQHLLEYVNDLNPILEDRILLIAWKPIELQLKRDLKKYESICERNSKNGSKGGRPSKLKKPNGLNKNPTKPKKADIDNDTDIDTVNDIDNGIKKRKSDFKKSLSNYLESYDKEMLNDFYFYWTEHGEKDKKMRFEKEKSFGLSRRLSTWKKKSIEFNKNSKPIQIHNRP